MSDQFLYPSLLGAAWNRLGESVRQVHLDGRPRRGRFRVRRGRRLRARVLAGMLGLPRAGRGVQIHAVRDFFYAVLFGTLPWLAWRGGWTAALAAVLVAEIVLTLADFRGGGPRAQGLTRGRARGIPRSSVGARP